MLILSRKLNESIVIDGRIVVKVMRVDGDVVKLGIAAPADVPVHREEVYEEIRRSNREAIAPQTVSVPRLLTTGAATQAHSRTHRWQERRLNPDTERQSPKPNQA